MSDRMTGVCAHGVGGVADFGRKTRAEMIQQYRDYYEHQRDEAIRALAVADSELVVETYLGPYAMKNREVVR